jgi:hypothetical protein
LDGRNLQNLSGDASVISDLFRVDEQGRVTLDEIAASNRSLRLWHDGLKQSEMLVRTGDLTLPPQQLHGVLPPPELSEALARHIEASVPPTGMSP